MASQDPLLMLFGNTNSGIFHCKNRLIASIPNCDMNISAFPFVTDGYGAARKNLEKIPDGYSGYIWTNRMDRVCR